MSLNLDSDFCLTLEIIIRGCGNKTIQFQVLLFWGGGGLDVAEALLQIQL